MNPQISSGQGLTPPRLEALFADFLRKQAIDQATGVILPPVAQDVVPYDAAPLQIVEPAVAWNHALSAVHLYALSAKKDWGKRQAPPDWANLVTQSPAAMAIPCCVGNYPQQLRELQPLFQNRGLDTPESRLEPFSRTGTLTAWAAEALQNGEPADLLIAAGVLRLAGDFEQAAKLLARLKSKAPAAWQSAIGNEEAALSWQEKHPEKAFAKWQSLPDSTPVCFNRGMAALFLGHIEEAKTHLKKAVAGLPDDNSWHHLGRLYLALAEASRA